MGVKGTRSLAFEDCAPKNQTGMSDGCDLEPFLLPQPFAVITTLNQRV